jgi:D-methionine transport system substrate-binding protein
VTRTTPSNPDRSTQTSSARPLSRNLQHGKGIPPRHVVGTHVEPLASTPGSSRPSPTPRRSHHRDPERSHERGRALLLLQSAKLITLDARRGLTATPQNITENAKKFQFKEIEAASLPRVLEDVDGAVINGNYAIPAGLSAKNDGLLVEGADSPYVNIVAVKAGNEKDPRIQALVKAITSQKVKDYINTSTRTGSHRNVLIKKDF